MRHHEFVRARRNAVDLKNAALVRDTATLGADDRHDGAARRRPPRMLSSTAPINDEKSFGTGGRLNCARATDGTAMSAAAHAIPAARRSVRPAVSVIQCAWACAA